MPKQIKNPPSVNTANPSVIPAKAGIQQASKKWIPNQVRDDKNIARNDKTTIPVYGSANQIVSDLKKMAAESTSTHPWGEQRSNQAHPGGVDIAGKFSLPTGTSNNKNKMIILAIALLLAIGAYLYFQKAPNPFSKPTLEINTLQDQQTNQKIETITGLGWNDISARKTGSTEEKLAALLLLHEEESWIFQKYDSLLSGKYIEASKLSGLKAVNTEVNKQNTTALLDNLIATVKAYDQIKVPEAKVHLNRLQLLKKYLVKYELSDSDKIPQQADTITLNSHPADNQKVFMQLLIARFNIFVNSRVRI